MSHIKGTGVQPCDYHVLPADVHPRGAFAFPGLSETFPCSRALPIRNTFDLLNAKFAEMMGTWLTSCAISVAHIVPILSHKSHDIRIEAKQCDKHLAQ